MNSLETRPVNKYIDLIQNNQQDNQQALVKVRDSFADNILCVGPRYQPEDISISFPSPLGKNTSGVLGNKNISINLYL